MGANRLTPGSTDDEAVMARVRQGDGEALGLLYDRFAPGIYRRGLAVLRCPEDAEEVIQETFAYVWIHAADYDTHRGSVASWISVVTRSRIIDRHRRDRRHAHAELPSEIATDTIDLAANLTIGDALETLAPPQREAIRLAYFDGCSGEEVAERQKVPLGTAKSRIRTGLRHLRAWFDGEAGRR